MNKRSFIESLKVSLNGKVEMGELQDTLSYYEKYFEDQKKLGGSEEDICRGLGEPKLIARSILNARSGSAGATQSEYSANQSLDEQPFKRENNNNKYKKWIYSIMVILFIGFIVRFMISLLFSPIFYIIIAFFFIRWKLRGN